MSFKLGRECHDEAKKSLRGLKAHIRKHAPKESSKTAIFVAINTYSPLARSKDYTPRIIPLTNPLDKLQNKSVLLVTKDPSTPYRHLLTEKDSATEDVFNQIYTVTRLRKMAANAKTSIHMFKEFDIIVADHRVHKLLPDILGPRFYAKNKKVPFVVQMAPPDPNAQLVKTKKSHKLKDERCEPKYVKAQMNLIAKNTYCFIPANGTSMLIKIGYSDWPTEKLVANLNDVLVFLMEKKYPSGGLIWKKDMLESVYVKTGESISLPVYKAKEEVPEESDSDSD